jgi:hypothetical protein
MPPYNPLLISSEKFPKRRTKRSVRSSLENSSRLHIWTACHAAVPHRHSVTEQRVRSFRRPFPRLQRTSREKVFCIAKFLLRVATTPHMWRVSRVHLISANRESCKISANGESRKPRRTVPAPGCCRLEKPERVHRARRLLRCRRRRGADKSCSRWRDR